MKPKEKNLQKMGYGHEGSLHDSFDGAAKDAPRSTHFGRFSRKLAAHVLVSRRGFGGRYVIRCPASCTSRTSSFDRVRPSPGAHDLLSTSTDTTTQRAAPKLCRRSHMRHEHKRRVNVHLALQMSRRVDASRRTRSRRERLGTWQKSLRLRTEISSSQSRMHHQRPSHL